MQKIRIKVIFGVRERTSRHQVSVIGFRAHGNFPAECWTLNSQFSTVFFFPTVSFSFFLLSRLYSSTLFYLVLFIPNSFLISIFQKLTFFFVIFNYINWPKFLKLIVATYFFFLSCFTNFLLSTLNQFETSLIICSKISMSYCTFPRRLIRRIQDSEKISRMIPWLPEKEETLLHETSRERIFFLSF